MVTVVKAEPLGRWAVPETPADQRRDAAGEGVPETIASFTWDEIAHILGSYVSALGAAEVRVGIDADADAIAAGNLDGGAFPGARVSFTGRHGQLVFHSDRYRSWRANVVEIAGLLEALAAADDYGAGGRQYAGWRVAPQAPAASPATPVDPVERLIELAQLGDEDPVEFRDNPARIRRAFLLAEHREDLTADQRRELRALRGSIGPQEQPT